MNASLEEELHNLQLLLANYEELECDIDNPEYVARGNGFCDAKYSEEFLDSRILSIKQRIALIEQQLKQV
ncbi:MAG: hypothetical protein HUK17_03415 [Bacteroidales bacterium]|nr:hypothetical protein [Bacteroidales bacterium]